MAGETIRSRAQESKADSIIRIIGLGLFFCWFWALAQDGAVSSMVAPDSPPLRFWGIALLSMVVAFIVLAILFRYFGRVRAFRVLDIALISASVLYAVALYFPILSGLFSGGLFVIAALGTLAALLFVCWGESVGALGPKRAVLCSGSALLVSCAAAFLAHQFDTRVAGVCFSIMPLVSVAIVKKMLRAAALERGSALRDSHQDVSDGVVAEKSQSGRFLATVFIQGMAFGLLHFLFSTVVMEKCDDPYCILRFLNGLFPMVAVHDFYGVMSIVGLALAGTIVVVGVLMLGLNFRKLIYVVGFPLMALGFLIISFDPA